MSVIQSVSRCFSQLNALVHESCIRPRNAVNEPDACSSQGEGGRTPHVGLMPAGKGPPGSNSDVY